MPAVFAPVVPAVPPVVQREYEQAELNCMLGTNVYCTVVEASTGKTSKRGVVDKNLSEIDSGTRDSHFAGTRTGRNVGVFKFCREERVIECGF